MKIRIGNVIYSPKVTVIWEMIREYMNEKGLETENVFFKDYPSQTDALMASEIDIAWDGPLAHVDAQLRSGKKCVAGAMRDTDKNRKTLFIVKSGSPVNSIGDLKNRTIGFTENNSPEGRLIPINYLHTKGLELGADFTEKNISFMAEMLGGIPKSGLSIINTLQTGEVDCSVFMDLYWNQLAKNGTIDPSLFRVIGETPLYDHCIFTANPKLDPEILTLWNQYLYEMDYGNERHKTMMDLEGLTKWVPGREEGFRQLEEAVELLRYFKDAKN